MGLESVEARLLVHENSEAAYVESIEFLMYDVRVRDTEIKQLKNHLDEALKEKDDLKLKLQKFEESSKNLTKLIDSQISANNKTGLSYDSQLNESQSNVDDNPVNDRFKIVEGFHAVLPPFTGNYLPPRADLSFAGLDDSVYRSDMKEWDSDSDEDEIVLKSVNEKHTNEKSEQPRKFSQSPRNDKKNYNERMTQKLGLGFGFTKKACFVYGSLNHLIRDCNYHKNKMVKRSMMKNVGKASDLMDVRPVNVTTAGHKAVVSSVRGNKVNAAKASAGWTWRPKPNVIDHGNPEAELKDTRIIDSGCSRHMTRNKSFLLDYKDLDCGLVAFGGNSKGGKVTSKGNIRTGNLDFEDVYFVKKLKYNLISVSQICDKKNSVLFINTECVVLSPEFKLPAKNQVVLRIPRNNNMYSIDLKNIVSTGGLTCLVAKALLDEFNLWHKWLGHINFKNLNKLVKGNLVRGLPS
ncbi:putative ribonuclease H-like domain-containing protein, partial [Tanacetum coccineum]